MVCTTFLSDSELNQPTGNADLDSLLDEAREVSGRNYQIVKHRIIHRYGLFGLRRRVLSRLGLYVEVPGVGPWQVLMCAQAEDTIFAYLYGLLNGAEARGESSHD